MKKNEKNEKYFNVSAYLHKKCINKASKQGKKVKLLKIIRKSTSALAPA
jgi:hypothetical protein